MVKIQEKTVQKALADYFSNSGYVVKREIRTPVGYIDLILYRNLGLPDGEKIMVETKEFAGLKHAVGQLMSYEKYQGDCTKLWIIYFTRDGKYRGVDPIFQGDQLRKQNKKFQISFIGELISLEELCQRQEELKTPNLTCWERSSESNERTDSLTQQIESLEFLQEQIRLTGVNFENISF